MGNTEGLTPVTLSQRHLDDAMGLVEQAGWNQCKADWRMMLAAGSGFGFEDADGRLIASAVVLPYGDGIGWIGMVLVAEAYQRRGLATRLIDQSVEALEFAGLSPCLDATPAGEPVYLKRGFIPDFSFHRWQREGKDSGPVAVQKLDQSDIDTAQRLDLQAFGSKRESLLFHVIKRGAPCVVPKDGTGFALSRAGSRAHQIGPIVARDEKAAITLFDQLNSAIYARVFIDIPDAHTALIARVQACGFTRQRPLTRMKLGPGTLQGTDRMFALFGPELG